MLKETHTWRLKELKGGWEGGEMDPSLRLGILLSHSSYMQTQLTPWCHGALGPMIGPHQWEIFHLHRSFCLVCTGETRLRYIQRGYLWVGWKILVAVCFKRNVFSLSRGTPSTTRDQWLALVWAWYKSTIKVNPSNIPQHAYPKLKPWTLGEASFGCASSEPSRMWWFSFFSLEKLIHGAHNLKTYIDRCS